jgi:hypothetical protein
LDVESQTAADNGSAISISVGEVLIAVPRFAVIGDVADTKFGASRGNRD